MVEAASEFLNWCLSLSRISVSGLGNGVKILSFLAGRAFLY